MKKFLALFLAMLMTMAVVTGCGSKEPDVEVPETTDTLVILSSGAFQGTWDPPVTPSSPTSIWSGSSLITWFARMPTAPISPAWLSPGRIWMTVTPCR